MKTLDRTPGPWQVHGSHVYGAGRELVCQVLSDNLTGDRDLIAAAPELLDALKGCVENFNVARIAMDEKSRELAGALVDEYRTIIGKAKGVK